jgi:hypothetical protein
MIEKSTSLTSIIAWSHYEIRFVSGKIGGDDDIEKSLSKWDSIPQVHITKKKKKGKKKVERQLDIKPLIGNVIYKGMDDEDFHTLSALLRSGESGNLKPIELVEAMERELDLGIDLDMVMIKRLEVFADEDGEIKELA